MTAFLTSIRGSLSDLVTLIDQELATPAPAPAPVTTYSTFTTCYQLFGPAQLNGALQQTPTGTFEFQGNALTASTKQLYLGRNVADVDVARVVAVWAPGSASNEIELIKFDNGPANIQRIAVMAGQNTSSPVTAGVVITDALQAMVDDARLNGTPLKHLGFRIKGASAYTLFEVRVEVSWKIPTP